MTLPYSNLPSPADLAKSSQRLASNNARVSAVLNSLPIMLDQLIAAADRRDWHEIVRQSESLAEMGRALKCDTLAIPAGELAAVAEARSSELEIKRHLLRVIGAAGRARKTSFLAGK
ncbi:hypothetical protein NA78x_001231 [Anatilimnocola sp. NA78]|uniref:hypothetical protein n=1 Tax=Anatilimnocola sp. NA78 TaxID=3415683 RepID=UPI003CE44D05